VTHVLVIAGVLLSRVKIFSPELIRAALFSR
jgi:hypothetical protein